MKWAANKVHRVARRADGEVDRALDAGLARLHDLVSQKLGGDSALRRLEDDARREVDDPGTRQWVDQAVNDAAERDTAFGAALREVLAEIKTIERQIASATGPSLTATDHSVAAGSVTSGSLFIGDGNTVNNDNSRRIEIRSGFPGSIAGLFLAHKLLFLSTVVIVGGGAVLAYRDWHHAGDGPAPQAIATTAQAAGPLMPSVGRSGTVPATRPAQAGLSTPATPGGLVAQPAVDGVTAAGYPFGQVTNAADGTTTVTASRNSTGGTNTITYFGPGRYGAFFGGLQTSGPTTSAGAILVRPLGPAGVTCQGGSYDNTASSEYVAVLCYDERTGKAVDGQFTATYLRNGTFSGAGGHQGGYAVDLDASAIRTGPTPEGQYDSALATQGSNTVIDQPTPGTYVVTLPRLGGPGGTARTTAIFDGQARVCANGQPATVGADLQITVHCTTLDGKPAQPGFSLIVER